MSLSRTLVQAVTEAKQAKEPEFKLINPAAYAHEYGARIIAMETLEALHDVFLESFYGCEQADILAIKDGIALEGSQYEAIVEGLSTNAVAKLKTIVKTLQEKVKAFLNHTVISIDKLTMESSKFFTTHEEEIKAIQGLKGFKFTMYDYTHEEFDACITEAIYSAKITLDDACKTINQILDKFNASEKGVDNSDTIDQGLENLKNNNSDEVIYSREAGNNTEVKTAADYRKYVFGKFRGGVAPGEKEEMDISDPYPYIQWIKNFKPVDIKKARAEVDSMYNDVYSYIDKVEKTIKQSDGTSATKLVEACRILTDSLSKTQNCINIVITEYAKAVKERDVAYKQMVMKALAYSRKSK